MLAVNHIKLSSCIMSAAEVKAAECYNADGYLVRTGARDGVSFVWQSRGEAVAAPLKLETLSIPQIQEFHDLNMVAATEFYGAANHCKKRARADAFQAVGYGALSVAFGTYSVQKAPTLAELDAALHSDFKIDDGVLSTTVAAAILAMASVQKVYAVAAWISRAKEDYIDTALALGNTEACQKAIAQARAPRQG